MSRGYLQGENAVSVQRPQLVADVQKSAKTIEISETINIANAGYFKDAAGVAIVVDLAYDKIRTQGGAEVGSFWGEAQNKMLEAAGQAFVETDGSAAVAINDAGQDLETIFESVTASRHVIRVTDGAGVVVYGWIGGVSVSGTVYTFTVFNTPALGTQNWFQGGATAFNANSGVKVEIFKYTTSFSFGSSGAFLEEVPYKLPEAGQSQSSKFLQGLSNGQFAIDYENGVLKLKKADASDTATITYKVKATAVLTAGSSGSLPTGVYNEDTAGASLDPGYLMLTRRQDTPITDTSLDGDYQMAKSDDDGAIWVRDIRVKSFEDEARSSLLTSSPSVITEVYNDSVYQFTGAAATAAIKASAGVITGFQLVNSGASNLWVIFNDDLNGITGADAAELPFPLPANSASTINSSFFKSGQYGFATGISIGISTTQATYTAYGTPSEVTGLVMYN